jgi:hypothetical protein
LKCQHKIPGDALIPLVCYKIAVNDAIETFVLVQYIVSPENKFPRFILEHFFADLGIP